MHILDAQREQPVSELQLYLSVRDATKLRDILDRLLKDPEANEHFHLSSEGSRTSELSCSILTPRKLESGHYTDLERKIFSQP